MTERNHRSVKGHRVGEAGNAFAVAGITAFMTLGLQLTVVSGHAASLTVDGGVTQVFTLDVPPPQPTGPSSACGDPSDYDSVIEGGNGDDVLLGTPGRDILLGYGGNDLLLGGRGDDCLLGGAGLDLLYGHKGHDLLHGGAGHDLLFGGWGEDSLDGGDGHNICVGGLTVVNCAVEPSQDASSPPSDRPQREPAKQTGPQADLDDEALPAIPRAVHPADSVPTEATETPGEPSDAAAHEQTAESSQKLDRPASQGFEPPVTSAEDGLEDTTDARP